MTEGTTHKSMTKSDVYNQIAEQTGLAKKDVSNIFDALAELITNELKKGKKTDTKQFTIPGLCKIVTKYKAATKEHMGINPFTKEETLIKAKPASQQVKVRPLKGLKDAVS